MQFRDYDRQTDRDAAIRVFREVGWITDTKHEEATDEIFGSGRTMVAEVEGSVECVVTSDPGTMCYLDEDLRLAAVTGVTTSRVARKRGLAGQLTARLIAEEAWDGAHVAMLGIFEQGYYNQLGFGNGSYEHWYTFDPALLLVTSEPRIPVRLGPDDWKATHENRLRRVRTHGGCFLTPAGMTRAEMLWSENGFGLGYRDDQGGLSHHFWCTAKETEHGPYTVLWMAYRTRDEFHELLALLRSLGDQVRSIKIHEPPSIQLQDLIKQPFKTRQMTQATPHEGKMTASPSWQARILDLAACLARTHLSAGSLCFNLRLTDPIERFLETDAPWRGIGGDYVVNLGSDSGCEKGIDSSLPTLDASVNAFTRLWLGVRSATGLAWTDDLDGPEDLLAQLDKTLRLPIPHPDWEF